MITQYLSTEPTAARPALSLSDWDGLLRSMCTMLDHTPATAMWSISVAGTLKGVEWSVQSLASLCKRLAEEYGLRQTLQVEAASFTVRFSRREGRRPVLRRKLGPSL